MHRPPSISRGRKGAIALKSPIGGPERPVTLALWHSAASPEVRAGRADGKPKVKPMAAFSGLV